MKLAASEELTKVITSILLDESSVGGPISIPWPPPGVAVEIEELNEVGNFSGFEGLGEDLLLFLLRYRSFLVEDIAQSEHDPPAGERWNKARAGDRLPIPCIVSDLAITLPSACIQAHRLELYAEKRLPKANLRTPFPEGG